MQEALNSPKPKWLEFYDLAMACGAFSNAPPAPDSKTRGDATLAFAVIPLPATVAACLEPVLRL